MSWTTKQTELLQEAVANWWVLLEQWSTTRLLSWAAEQAWGDGEVLDTVRDLEKQAASGDTSWVPSKA